MQVSIGSWLQHLSRFLFQLITFVLVGKIKTVKVFTQCLGLMNSSILLNQLRRLIMKGAFLHCHNIDWLLHSIARLRILFVDNCCYSLGSNLLQLFLIIDTNYTLLVSSILIESWLDYLLFIDDRQFIINNPTHLFLKSGIGLYSSSTIRHLSDLLFIPLNEVSPLSVHFSQVLLLQITIA